MFSFGAIVLSLSDAVLVVAFGGWEALFAGKVASFGEISSLDSGLGASALDTVLFMRPPQLAREMVSWLDTISGSVFFFVFFLLLLLKTSLIESHGCNNVSK